MRFFDVFKHLFSKQDARAKVNNQLASGYSIDQQGYITPPEKFTTNITKSSKPNVPPVVKNAVQTNVVPSNHMDNTLDTLINTYATKYGYNPTFIRALVSTESSGNPNAKSKVGAYGLTQLTENALKDIGQPIMNMERLLNPETNLDMAGQYLEKLRSRYPNSFTNPTEIYRLWNTGNPNGVFEKGAEQRFINQYAIARSRSK